MKTKTLTKRINRILTLVLTIVALMVGQNDVEPHQRLVHSARRIHIQLHLGQRRHHHMGQQRLLLLRQRQRLVASLKITRKLNKKIIKIF